MVLAESALELVPSELWGHAEIRQDARRKGVQPGEILLDRSYHHRAMLRLRDGERRGRPDIVHFALLCALETPLGMVNQLRVHVHTFTDLVLEVAPETRLPRNYLRFKGLVEKALKEGRAPVDDKSAPLLTVKKQGFAELLSLIGPSKVVGLSRLGEPKPLSEIALDLTSEDNAVVVVGAFPRGHFGQETSSLLHKVYTIDPAPLETWIVTARVVYAVERVMGLETRRISELQRARLSERTVNV